MSKFVNMEKRKGKMATLPADIVVLAELLMEEISEVAHDVLGERYEQYYQRMEAIGRGESVPDSESSVCDSDGSVVDNDGSVFDIDEDADIDGEDVLDPNVDLLEEMELPEDEDAEVLAFGNIQENVPSCSSTGPTKAELNKLIVLDGDEEVDDTDLREFKKTNRNKNTATKTTQVTRRFQQFLVDKYEDKRRIETIPPQKLNFYIGNFLLTLKKVLPKGVDPESLSVEEVEYQPETLTSYHRAIARHLRDEGYPYEIMKAHKFVSSKGVLSTRKSQLKKQGLGNKPNRCIAFGEQDEIQCWEKGALGASTPRILQHTVFYQLATSYGWRARHEADQCLWGDLEIKTGVDGREYIEWTERATKTRNGEGEPRAFPPKVFATGTDRCPIKLFRLYASKRPAEKKDDMSPLFLTPKPKASMESAKGYIDGKMGPNSLAAIMGKIAQAGGIPGRIAGHTVRKTCASKLYHAGVPNTMICEITGLKDTNSIMNYAGASYEQQQAMSDMINEPVIQDFSDVMKANRAKRQKIRAGTPAANMARSMSTTCTIPSMGNMKSDATAMLYGATINGDVHININYNIAGGHQSTQVNQASPKIPVIDN